MAEQDHCFDPHVQEGECGQSEVLFGQVGHSSCYSKALAEADSPV